MNKTVKLINHSRPDLSDYLFHFTKGAKALDSLWSIIHDEKIKDIRGSGVICFTEAPLYNMLDMFKIFQGYQNPMYAPYGVAIPKSAIYKLGGRPVIYGPKSEKNLLDKSIHWRYEELTESHDFSWLREWRIPASEVVLNPKEVFIITKTEDEGQGIIHSPDVVIDGDYADGQWWDTSYVAWDREWKSISIETINNQAISNSQSLLKELDSQKLTP